MLWDRDLPDCPYGSLGLAVSKGYSQHCRILNLLSQNQRWPTGWDTYEGQTMAGNWGNCHIGSWGGNYKEQHWNLLSATQVSWSDWELLRENRIRWSDPEHTSKQHLAGNCSRQTAPDYWTAHPPKEVQGCGTPYTCWQSFPRVGC